MALAFGAPRSRSLKTASRIAGLLLIGTAAAGVLLVPAQMPWVRIFMVAMPASLMVSALLSMVSSYTLTTSTLEIERPLWTTRYPLADLSSVTGGEDMLHGSLRLFGNGGLFSYTGIFWSRKLGLFRAYGTDLSRAVVLKFAKRTVVVTPDDPLHFIVRVRTHLASAAREAH